MFARAGRGVRQGENQLEEILQPLLLVHGFSLRTAQKSHLQALVLLIKPPEEVHQVQQISVIESAVLKPEQLLQVILLVLQNELVRRVVHALQQLPALVNDGLALSPGQNGGKKTGNLHILPAREQVRNRHRVIWNKVWGVVPLVPVI